MRCIFLLVTLFASASCFSMLGRKIKNVLPNANTLQMSTVREISGAEFEVEIADQTTPILLDIYATWCGPCMMLAPELEKAAERLGDKVRVMKIDSDKEEKVASALHVYALPTLLYIKDGSVVYRTEGALQVEDILKVVGVQLLDIPAEENPIDDLFISYDP